MVKYVLTILAKALALWALVGVSLGVMTLISLYTYGLGLYALAFLGALALTALVVDASLRTCRRIRTPS
jgi:hypothetical protein